MPQAGSSEGQREATGVGRAPIWETPLLPTSWGALFQPLLLKQQCHYLGRPANQIGQQTGNLCGVGTAPVSLTVYPAVFLKTEISARVTTAVSYWLRLRVCLGGGGIPPQQCFAPPGSGSGWRNVSLPSQGPGGKCDPGQVPVLPPLG